MPDYKIGIIGLGYVGLPLAIEFAKKYPVIGFDINHERVQELSNGQDRTKEADLNELKQVLNMKEGFGLKFSNQITELKDCNIYIVTVPTPINEFKAPDLTPLRKASEAIGSVLKKGDIVIYESTVYPGCTEEECAPILEKTSDLKLNTDFFLGYSPERINPGDKEHTVTKILKVTSGSTPEAAVIIDNLYKSIISAGTHLASSIKVAEAAKVIENTQRDINIAFVNELALIFDRMGIDTTEVLTAAGTKWNFLKYKPGLVGGHCIGVDPYYLAYKAQSLGYHPEVILSGRRVNDNMGVFVANKVIKLMINKGMNIKSSRVLILGFAFKENCTDFRNTRIMDIYHEMLQFGVYVEILDPYVNSAEVREEYNIKILKETNFKYDAIILAVAHDIFRMINLQNLIKADKSIIFDIKSYLNESLVDGRL